MDIDIELELKNYTKYVVFNNLDKILKKNNAPCSCSKCKIDIMAIALNNLPSKYVVTKVGEHYAKFDSYENQSIINVVVAVSNAIEIVSKKPRHNEV